jgi:hypothetical protein
VRGARELDGSGRVLAGLGRSVPLPHQLPGLTSYVPGPLVSEPARGSECALWGRRGEGPVWGAPRREGRRGRNVRCVPAPPSPFGATLSVLSLHLVAAGSPSSSCPRAQRAGLWTGARYRGRCWKRRNCPPASQALRPGCPRLSGDRSREGSGTLTS